MKAKKISISQSDINSLPYVEVELTYTDLDGNETYPVAIQYVNGNSATAAVLGFLCLSSDDEKDESVVNSSYYDYLLLPAGNSVADLPPTKYLRIKLVSGTATTGLDVYVYNYVAWKA